MQIFSGLWIQKFKIQKFKIQTNKDKKDEIDFLNFLNFLNFEVLNHVDRSSAVLASVQRRARLSSFCRCATCISH